MYLGIDVGTSITKAAAFDRDGQLLAVEARPTTLSRPTEGWCEQDLSDVLASVAQVVQAVTATAGQPHAIGLTGQGDGLWLTDTQGAAVRPAVSWMDGRAANIVADWITDGTVAEVFRRTGHTMFPGSAGPILAWMRTHEPEALERAATAGYCKDAVMAHLTGVRATDASDASLPFLSPHTGEYDSQALRLCGLSEHADLLAPVSTPLPTGRLRGEVAAELGLRPGTAVSCGPFDLPASALGAGITAAGDGLLIIGTTLACQVVIDEVDTGGEPTGMTLATGTGDRWLRAMPAMVGTAATDWTLRLVNEPHDRLDALLADSPIGARDVNCLPYFSPSGERAPFLEPHARAAFDGLSLHHEAADLVRATCEAVAFAARHCFEAAGLRGEVAMCGGGTASNGWLQIFADVLDRPLHLAPQPETGARGAALAAARGAGNDIDTTLWTTAEGVIEPDAGRAARYRELYAAYLNRVEAARPKWKDNA